MIPMRAGSTSARIPREVHRVIDFLAAVDTEWRTLLYSLVTALVILAYYALARWLGKRWPKVETLMLGSSKTPTYTTT